VYFSKVQKTLAELPEEEAALSRAETLLRALGVKSEERMRMLVSYFFKDENPHLGQRKSTNGADQFEGEELPGELRLLFNSPEDEAELSQMIRPEDVIAAVKAFVDDVADGPNVLGSAGTPHIDEAKRGGRKRLQSLQHYWGQLSQVVGDDSVAVWRQLEKDLLVYKQILQQRTDRISEVDALARRNAELKKLLNQYLGARSNEFLQIPPAQTMRLRPVGVGSATASKVATKPMKGKKVLMSTTH